jgi:hypothetical protein
MKCREVVEVLEVKGSAKEIQQFINTALESLPKLSCGVVVGTPVLLNRTEFGGEFMVIIQYAMRTIKGEDGKG